MREYRDVVRSLGPFGTLYLTIAEIQPVTVPVLKIISKYPALFFASIYLLPIFIGSITLNYRFF
jgi:hypothetical protein